MLAQSGGHVLRLFFLLFAVAVQTARRLVDADAEDFLPGFFEGRLKGRRAEGFALVDDAE